MRRFLLELQFYGRNYNGFQRQGNTHSTVQETVENALKKLFGVPVQITGCSRTDAGVSAESYFCHFDVDTKLPAERVCFKLNKYLPKDISSVSSREVAPAFDARKDVKRKTYVYTLYKSEHRLPLYEQNALRVSEKFDITAVKNAAAFFVGRHDFSAFRTIGYEKDAEKKSTTRTLYEIRVFEEGKTVKILFTGDGFLYNMARILTGSLIEVGEGERTAESLKAALDEKERSRAGRTAPPKGLRLLRVEY